MSTEETLVAALRTAILDGELAPGARLTERRLTEDHDVARHTARTALRTLEAEGLVRVERHRGARVAGLDAGALRGLFELRTALEVEAAHRMLARTGGRPAPELVDAVESLAAVCARRAASWRAVVEAHEAVHRALVVAGRSERIAAAHAALEGEMRLFVVALRPVWDRPRMAAHHRALLDGLRADGTDALRQHLDEGEAAVLARLDARRAG